MFNNDNRFFSSMEWEGLQYKYEFGEKILFPFVGQTSERIEVWRGKDYKINAKVIGVFDNPTNDLSYSGKPGEFVKPFEVSGFDKVGTEAYLLRHCYLGPYSSTYRIDASGNWLKQFEAELRIHYAEKRVTHPLEVSWLTEWYINGPRDYLYPRSTEREMSEVYTRNRVNDKKFGPITQNNSQFDHAFVDAGNIKFIIHRVPKEFEPTWTEKVGIEYRRELSDIPDSKGRGAISEIVSFIFGRNLLNVGFSVFSEQGYAIEEVIKNPSGDNVYSVCQQPGKPPIDIMSYEYWGKLEQVLAKLVPQYLELREILGLKEALWRYWFALTAPIGTNLPILANAVEILSSSWFKANDLKVRGVYMNKREFEALLVDELNHIEAKLTKVKFGERMIRKIRDCFQMSGNERLYTFFEALGIELNENEMEAIRARNYMVHGAIDMSDDTIKKFIQLSNAYVTLFNRIFLKLLGYEGMYKDYSSLGHPEKKL